MNIAKYFRLLSTVLGGVLTLALLSIAHAVSSAQPLHSMDTMANHAVSTTQCQMLCFVATQPEEQRLANGPVDEDKEPQPRTLLLSQAGVGSLGVLSAVRQPYLLSSWRPPDLVLLHGHYADGL